MSKTIKTLLNETTATIRSTFTIASDLIVSAIANVLVSSGVAENAIAVKTAAYKAGAEAMDDAFNSKWLDAKFQAVKAGCKDLAAGYAKIAGDVDLSVNQVKELHQVYLAFTAEEIGGSKATWQNIKEWSKYATGPKAKHPDVKKAQVAAKLEAEAQETTDDKVAKVLKILVSQYQYLGKIEEANDRAECLMQDLADVLKLHGVDLEAI
jgi:hypothetical protein